MLRQALEKPFGGRAYPISRPRGRFEELFGGPHFPAEGKLILCKLLRVKNIFNIRRLD
jgi:hypothetical protein